jgi:hypothetical protein
MNNNVRERLSRLMKLSWDIQQNRHNTRSKALKSGWAIVSNEDITAYYLVKKVMPEKADPAKVGRQLGLFNFA